MPTRRALWIALTGTLVACTGTPPGPPAEGTTKASVISKRTPQLAELIGKVKAPATLISDKGGAVVSNNAAGLVSNNGGGGLAPQGARLRDGGAGRYGLAAAAWLPVAGRAVTLTDAQGKTVAGPVTTDAAGAFRFAGVATEKAWVVRADLGAGRRLEALARTGTAAEVTPASTVALAVARSRLPDVATADAAAVGRLTAALAPVLLADETLLDLAAPLTTFTRVAAERPAVASAADGLTATPAGAGSSAAPSRLPASPAAPEPIAATTPKPPVAPSATASPGGPASPGATASPIAPPKPAPDAATPWAVLPETPVGLVAFGERTFVVLPGAKTICVDTSPTMPKVATLAFTPSLTMAVGANLYVFDRAGGQFQRFVLGGSDAAPTCVAAGVRAFGILPAPSLTAGAVDDAGNILAAVVAATLPIPVSQGQPVAQMVAPSNLSFTGLLGGLKAATQDKGGWFWVGTGEDKNNLFKFEIANIPDRPQPTGERFTVPGPIRDLVPDGTGGLLIATSLATDGLFTFQGGVVEKRPTPIAVDRVAMTASRAIRALSGGNLHRL